MIITGLVLGLVVVIGMLASYYVAYRVIRTKIKTVFSDFMESPGPGIPSPLGVLVDSASRTAGRAIAMEVKTTLMGKSSAASRQESGIMEDIATDQLNQQMPLLGGLLEVMPSLKKRLIKNPGLLQSLGGILQSSGLGSVGSGSGGGNHESSSTNSTKINYQKYK